MKRIFCGLLIVQLILLSSCGNIEKVTESNNSAAVEQRVIDAEKTSSEHLNYEPYIPVVQSHANLDWWIGDYWFCEFYPSSIGSNKGIYYSISIKKEASDYYAEIYVDGWMTCIRWKAKVSGNEKVIELLFDDILPDNLHNEYNKNLSGVMVLRLKRDNAVILTEWGELTPMISNNEQEGIYFTKTSGELLKYSFDWNVLYQDGKEGAIAYPVLILNEQNESIDITEQINDTIYDFLLKYMNEFVDGSFFYLENRISHFDNIVFSVRFDGEVATPSKAIPQTFELSFDLRDGSFLSLTDSLDNLLPFENFQIDQSIESIDKYSEVEAFVVSWLKAVKKHDGTNNLDYYETEKYGDVYIWCYGQYPNGDYDVRVCPEYYPLSVFEYLRINFEAGKIYDNFGVLLFE